MIRLVRGWTNYTIPSKWPFRWRCSWVIFDNSPLESVVPHCQTINYISKQLSIYVFNKSFRKPKGTRANAALNCWGIPEWWSQESIVTICRNPIRNELNWKHSRWYPTESKDRTRKMWPCKPRFSLWILYHEPGFYANASRNQTQIIPNWCRCHSGCPMFFAGYHTEQEVLHICLDQPWIPSSCHMPGTKKSLIKLVKTAPSISPPCMIIYPI